MSTALDLITLAQKTAGILAEGQDASAESFNDSLKILNAMLASWSQSRWLIYHLIDVKTQSTGATSYTIGPAGDFNAPRPDNIESAYVRQLVQGTIPNSGPIDFPLVAINTYEEYGDLTLKSLTSFPAAYFYDPTLTLGTLYVWPIPSDQFEIHMIIKDVLPQFAKLTDVINLPPEYYNALMWNLAARIQLMWQLPVNPGIVKLAESALNTISNANNRVPMLMMPNGLSNRRSGWNINSTGGVYEGVGTYDETVWG